MGVKLDWNIEAEKGKRKEHHEDSKQRGARYLGVFRLLMTVVIFAAILAGVVYLVLQRWEQVNQKIELLLTDTVQAEVAALRLGDLSAFEDRQRSATSDWIVTQRQVYEDYQALKVNSNVILSGRIIDTEIDGQRARVQVEEIIDGIPYVQTWFYWRYETEDDRSAGWYHVPPDYTFWGTTENLTQEDYVIRYSSIDTTTADLVDQSLSRWFADVCTIFACDNVPLITIDIIPAPQAPAQWSNSNPNAWHLLIPSPHTERARADMPFNANLQIEAASLLSQRILSQTIDTSNFVPSSDAAYLHESIRAWMVGRFVQLNPETYLIDSLVNNYGTETLEVIQNNLQPTSNISLLASAAGVNSISDLSVDWRDFVLWRLEREDDLIEQGDSVTWASLYDFSESNVQLAAQERFANNFTASNRTVVQANVLTSDAGLPQLIAIVNVTRGFETGDEIIVFNLVNGNWLRAN